MFTYRASRRPARPRRRSRWFLTGSLVAGGMVVATGLTGVAAAAADRVTVPCDSDRLIAALVRANAEGGGELRLARNCTYTLTEAFQQPDDYDGGIRDAREAADTAENPGDAETPPRDPKDDKAGLPVIYHPITIQGEGATIRRAPNADEFRFFTVRDGGELDLSDVVLKNGRSAAEGGSIHVVHGAAAAVRRTTIIGSTSRSAEGGGGGIFNDGNMVISDSTFVGNRAIGKEGKGGGLLNGGVLTLDRSKFVENAAESYGGGFGNYRGAAEVHRSTFADNEAAQGGGFASFSARSKVSDVRVIGNTAEVGGGIANSDAVLYLRGMTIRDNTATVKGGGISTFQGLLPLDESTITHNTSEGDGGGIHAEKSNLLVRRSDVSRNDADSKAGGIFVAMGQVSLFRSRVADNVSDGRPGGLFVDKAQANVDDETEVSGNEPSNCLDSTAPVPNCFR